MEFADACYIFLPTIVDPVKLIFLTLLWSIKYYPATFPYPGTQLNIPGGNPAYTINSQNFKVARGVSSLTFITIVFPKIKYKLPLDNAGPNFHAAINKG